MTEDINMNWKSDGCTVYALNEQGVNGFSFPIQGNGRSGYNPRKLLKVAAMAESAPDMYRALKKMIDMHIEDFGCEGLDNHVINEACEALVKADGEQHG